jgi:predicted CoA-binding protein
MYKPSIFGKMKAIDPVINEFINLKTFALIGASARKKKFGNMILKEMLKRGMNVYPVHKNAIIIDSTPCYPDIQNLPEKPDGVILAVHPEQTDKLVKEIAAAGIKYVWMQQGAESKTAVEYCTKHGIKVISRECLLMFLYRPGFPHNFHHWIWGLGK